MVRTRLPRAAVILVVYGMLALLVAVIGYVVIPSVVREVHTLSHDAPHYAAQLRHNAAFRHYDDRHHICDRQVIIDIKNAVARYTLGNIVISVLATVATWIVLSILGVPYALALGLVVGFFDLVPLVGATLGAIVVALATVPVSFPTATIVWIAFIIVWQRFEDYVVQPLVYGRAVNVNPLVTIISLLVGAELLGILGVLLAIPTAAAIQIILREWWRARGPKAAGSGADEGPAC